MCSLILIRTLITYMLIGIAFLICGPPALLMLCLPPKYRFRNKVYLFFVDLFYRATLRAGFMPIDIKGKENIPHTPAIIIANHQSSLDIPLVGSLLNRHPHVWFTLAYYARHPILGFIVRRAGVIVDTQVSYKAARSLIQVMRLAEKYRCHIIIFPEGARFADRQVHTFFAGFAILAKKTGFPVIPICIINNYKIYPPGSFLIHRYPIKAYIGAPMVIQAHETDEQFVERVRAWFIATLEKPS